MQDNLPRGAVHALYAAGGFALTGVCIKAASATTPNEVMVFVRCAVSLLTLLPWILARGARNALTTRRLGGHLWRAGFGVCAMYCFFYAIAHLHLAEAMLLTYSTPLWIPFIAWLWIREKPPLIVFPAVLLGLAGIALIVKPGATEIPWLAGLVGLASGMFAACAMVSIRRISDTEPALRIVFYFALLATVISAVPLLWAWDNPSPLAWLLLAGAGVSATYGQINLTKAYAFAPAARVGPFTYTAVIFSALLAWLIWGETLDRWSALGCALVILTCVMVGWRRKEPRLEE